MNSAIGTFDSSGKRLDEITVESIVSDNMALQRRIIELEAQIVQLTPLTNVVGTQRYFVVPTLPDNGNTDELHGSVQHMLDLIYAMLLNGASDYEIKQRIMGLG